MTYPSKIPLIDIKEYQQMTFSIFINIFFLQKIGMSIKIVWACFIRYSCHASDHNKNWTQECRIYKQNTFFVFSGKITKNSYKITGSFFQFFDCTIIANKRGLIEPSNKKINVVCHLKTTFVYLQITLKKTML
jgi:hypothetical protein